MASPLTNLGDDWKKYQAGLDPKTSLTPAQQQRVNDFSKLVSHADDKRFAEELPNYLNLDEFARFMAVTVWLSTMDSILALGQNFYVYLEPKTEKFQFMPWDLDHSFGQFGMRGTQDQRDNLSIQHPWQGENRLLERVFKVDFFKQLYLARLKRRLIAPSPRPNAWPRKSTRLPEPFAPPSRLSPPRNWRVLTKSWPGDRLSTGRLWRIRAKGWRTSRPAVWE